MWFYLATGLIVVVSIIFYFRQRQKPTVSPRRGARMETSTELGIPAHAVNPQRAFRADRESGVYRPRPMAPLEKDEPWGFVSDRKIKTDALSKEVELAWEASGAIELQPGAWARDEDYEKDFYKSEYYELPSSYGENTVVLLPKDPKWVYAYWEVAHERYKELYNKHLDEWGLSRPVLRIYDLSQRGSRPKDIELPETAREWYVCLENPRHLYMAEYGRLFEPDLFIPLAYSNRIMLPPDDYSEVVPVDYAPILGEHYYGGASTGHGTSPSTWGK